MGYVRFDSSNYSYCYQESRPAVDDDGQWYEVPEPGEYKLEDGDVISITIEERAAAFYAAHPESKDHLNTALSNYITEFLNDTDWIIQRHVEQTTISDATTTTSLTDSEYTYLLNYRQYLRNLTNGVVNGETFEFQRFSLSERYDYPSYRFILDLLGLE